MKAMKVLLRESFTVIFRGLNELQLFEDIH